MKNEMERIKEALEIMSMDMNQDVLLQSILHTVIGDYVYRIDKTLEISIRDNGLTVKGFDCGYMISIITKPETSMSSFPEFAVRGDGNAFVTEEVAMAVGLEHLLDPCDKDVLHTENPIDTLIQLGCYIRDLD